MAQIGSFSHEHRAGKDCVRCQDNPDYSSKDAPYKGVGSLGNGAFGSVERVTKKYDDQWGPSSYYTQLEFARKKFQSTTKMSAKEAQRKERENMWKISNLSESEQRHMVMLIQSYTVDGNDPDHGHHFLVTYPVANKGSLWQLLEVNDRHGLDPEVQQNLSTIMGCLVTGLAILHRSQLRHHDIHPGNILVHDGRPLYTDFGLTYDFANARNSHTYDQRPRQHDMYAAPECFSGPSRGKSADVFMLGGVLYELVAFLADDLNMLRYRPTKSDAPFGKWDKSQAARSALDSAISRTSDPVSSFWLQLTRSMLEWEPNSRPEAMNIVLYYLQGRNVCSHCNQWYSEMRDLNAKAVSAKSLSAQKASTKHMSKKHTSKKDTSKKEKSTEPTQTFTETIQSLESMTLQAADTRQRSTSTPQYPPATTQYPGYDIQYPADAPQYYTVNDPQDSTNIPRYYTNTSQYYPTNDPRYAPTAYGYPSNDGQPYYSYDQGSSDPSRYKQQ